MPPGLNMTDIVLLRKMKALGAEVKRVTGFSGGALGAEGASEMEERRGMDVHQGLQMDGGVARAWARRLWVAAGHWQGAAKSAAENGGGGQWCCGWKRGREAEETCVRAQCTMHVPATSRRQRENLETKRNAVLDHFHAVQHTCRCGTARAGPTAYSARAVPQKLDRGASALTARPQSTHEPSAPAAARPVRPL